MANQTRTDKELLDATRPFTEESAARSWWSLVSTLAVLGLALAGAALAPHWALRVLLGVFAGLVIVRGFILYHDHMHGALLKDSRPAQALMALYGTLVLTPPRVWRQTHNYHHAHTGQIVGSHIGSFVLVTTDMWRRLGPMERMKYRAVRHPLTVALGYFTIFAWGMCVSSFLRDPKKHWDSAAALVLQAALTAVVWGSFGFETYVFAMLIPQMVACAAGSYLFYAQHTFEDLHIQPREEWNYVVAATESSSFMETGPVMQWLTGNIGFHHVHHLNPRIPFYRLPETMRAIPELQNPKVTRLTLRDVVRNFQLGLWDPQAGRMVTYAEATRPAAAASSASA
jgi:omega-6 fatty acid desaturase (delta-12 desaturase)